MGPGVEAKQSGPTILPMQYPMNTPPDTVAFLVCPAQFADVRPMLTAFAPTPNVIRTTPAYLRVSLSIETHFKADTTYRTLDFSRGTSQAIRLPASATVEFAMIK